MSLRLVVVGGGIVGLATAYRYLLRNPGAAVAVLEKEAAVAAHQSGRNSGVLHAGLAYRPGSVKAALAVAGIRQMTAFCAEHEVPFEICGKLVVAAADGEVPRLRELQRRGTANGLRGLRWLSPEEAREIEPHVECVAALHVPEEGIVDFPGVCRALARRIEELGGEVRTGSRLTRIRRKGSAWELGTPGGGYRSRLVVNCAGLHADRVARLAGERPRMRIVPFRGEYFQLRPERRHLVRNLIYPAPDPAFPFLGVHLTRTYRGGIEAGPNAVLALAREGYGAGRIDPGDVWEMIHFPGLRRFLRRYPRATWEELRRSLSKELFAASLRRLVPAIERDDLVRDASTPSGVRAQALDPSGALIDDFVLHTAPGAVHVLNAPSPAATAALAIGKVVVNRLEEVG